MNEKIFGFGMMRLPMNGGVVNTEEVSKMVDLFLENGFTYFDTAHGYLNGESEKAVKTCLSSRYPRDKYLLTNKLTGDFFKEEKDIIPFFESQLEACGVEYFDYYLMHAQGRGNYNHFEECHAYETAQKLKEAGKVKHVGLSFHDSADFLDKILTEHPEIEVVQIQMNYLDYLNPIVQSKAVYDVCVKHNKPVIVMEPVKGGTLVNIPEEAKKIFDELNNGSYASYAVRYAASFDKVYKVLSGMSNLEQMQDNISYMKDFKKINEEEKNAIEKVVKIIEKVNSIPCTGCSYCTSNCPIGMPIPDIFKCYNMKELYHNWGIDSEYAKVTNGKARANECLKCGNCEQACPQHLKIREFLEKASKVFDEKD